jgi:NAD(P)-dependent dehydrogenase (short-subunit alcohol dehydrogenase family)
MNVPLTSHSRSFRLHGKLAVITGGASGIGGAIAKEFAGSGACVRLLDIDETAARKLVSEIVAAASGNARRIAAIFPSTTT